MLIAGVIVGQALTLLIVILLPPPRPPVHTLGEIASVLEGNPARTGDERPLVRRQGAPPKPPTDPHRARFVDERRLALAGLLGVPEDRVILNLDRPPPMSGFPFAGFHGRGGPPHPPSDPDRLPSSGQPRDWRPPPPFERHERFSSPEAGDHGDLVFGRFEAALRQPSGGWIIVSPAADNVLSAWQWRVIAWFLVCLGVLGPAGYLFARRLVHPITAFAHAAERLGRDPRGELAVLGGPSEIGVAARAFNDMQARLKRYVEDRVSMIGSISHDLRTPLARIRFKLERAPAEVRDAVAPDIEQMEAMIAAALAFVKDAARTPEREQLDLLSVLECVVDDARSTGGDVDLSPSPPLILEGDAPALQRLVANLVDNGIKYGRRVRLRLFADAGDAVIEVADEGPGLPSSEFERVFEPFYRTESSRSRDTGGVGLGLTVARSIARAHGGDIDLRSPGQGLTAQVRLPLAWR